MSDDTQASELADLVTPRSVVAQLRAPTKRQVLQELATADLEDVAPEFRRDKDLWLITDDNMATEFKRGRRPLFSPYGWGTELKSVQR